MGVYKKQNNWWIDFYHQGKRVRRKVGPSKKMAETVLADVMVKKAKSEFLGVCEPKRVLFKDFAREYLEYSKANKAKSSYERDVTTITKHLMARWGDEYLDRISPKMVEDYKLWRLDSVMAATVNRELNTVKNLFRKAVEWGYLKDSAAKTAKWMKTSKGSFRFLSQEECDLLLEAARVSPSAPHLYAVLVVALHTGMRRGEILRLRWEDVDFKKRRILVVSREGGHTKNYESRSVPMSLMLTDTLRKHPRRFNSPYVFCGSDGKPFHDVRTSFAQAVSRAKIPPVRFHDLRHTFASSLVMKGVDIRTVQELLGHKDIRMTMRYSHLAPDHMRNAVAVLDSPSQGGDRVFLDGHYLDTKGLDKEKGRVLARPIPK